MVRFALAQIDPKVGDLDLNSSKIKESIDSAEKSGADILVFPELALNGYPVQDLALRMDFLERTHTVLEDIADYTKDKHVTVLLGSLVHDGDCRDSLVAIRNGEMMGIYNKMKLPNYSVFDEMRYFKPGDEYLILETPEGRIGLTVCEDIWTTPGPVEVYSSLGVDAVVNISASPFNTGKIRLRRKYISSKAFEHNIWIIYVNLVGGQDELVFDGSSMVIDPRGEVVLKLESFEEDFAVMDVDLKRSKIQRLIDSRTRWLERPNVRFKTIEIPLSRKDRLKTKRSSEWLGEEEEILRALMLALRDYVHKNGFEKVVIGLSGGIDSSLVAAVSTLSLGPENVKGVLMPSMFTSKESLEDARELAENLGIETFEIPITDVYESYIKSLSEVFRNTQQDITEENIQARIRGNYLMALSNKFGWLVVTTGNKSEYATGYATLYGDMAGGYALIKDLYKTDVYRIARWINEREGREVIPKRVFEKPPSAELRPGQTDQEKLPPYEVLDGILRLVLEENVGYDEVVSKGFDPETVEYVLKLLRSSEYKRYQSAPGPKLTNRLFGRDWRMPITNGYRFI